MKFNTTFTNPQELGFTIGKKSKLFSLIVGFSSIKIKNTWTQYYDSSKQAFDNNPLVIYNSTETEPGLGRVENVKTSLKGVRLGISREWSYGNAVIYSSISVNTFFGKTESLNRNFGAYITSDQISSGGTQQGSAQNELRMVRIYDGYRETTATIRSVLPILNLNAGVIFTMAGFKLIPKLNFGIYPDNPMLSYGYLFPKTNNAIAEINLGLQISYKLI